MSEAACYEFGQLYTRILAGLLSGMSALVTSEVSFSLGFIIHIRIL